MPMGKGGGYATKADVDDAARCRDHGHGPPARPVLATPATGGFVGTTLAVGRFGDINVFNHLIPPEFWKSRHNTDVWLSWQKTKGSSDVYIQSNVFPPGASSGWHTHPGHSLIIVAAGTVSAYDGDDRKCRPHVYTQGWGSSIPAVTMCTTSGTKTPLWRHARWSSNSSPQMRRVGLTPRTRGPARFDEDRMIRRGGPEVAVRGPWTRRARAYPGPSDKPRTIRVRLVGCFAARSARRPYAGPHDCEARRRIAEAMELFIDNARTATIVDDVKLPRGAAHSSVPKRGPTTIIRQPEATNFPI
jgi:hypothetical protein